MILTEEIENSLKNEANIDNLLKQIHDMDFSEYIHHLFKKYHLKEDCTLQFLIRIEETWRNISKIAAALSAANNTGLKNYDSESDNIPNP